MEKKGDITKNSRKEQSYRTQNQLARRWKNRQRDLSSKINRRYIQRKIARRKRQWIIREKLLEGKVKSLELRSLAVVEIRKHNVGGLCERDIQGKILAEGKGKKSKVSNLTKKDIRKCFPRITQAVSRSKNQLISIRLQIGQKLARKSSWSPPQA